MPEEDEIMNADVASTVIQESLDQQGTEEAVGSEDSQQPQVKDAFTEAAETIVNPTPPPAPQPVTQEQFTQVIQSLGATFTQAIDGLKQHIPATVAQSETCLLYTSPSPRD